MVPFGPQLFSGLNRGEKQGVGDLEGGSHLLIQEPERGTQPLRPNAALGAPGSRLRGLPPLSRSRDPIHPDPANSPARSEGEPAVLGPGGAALRAAASA